MIIPPHWEYFGPQKLDHAGDGNTWPPFASSYPPFSCYRRLFVSCLSTFNFMLEEILSLSLYIV
jgi:hypothetical protein